MKDWKERFDEKFIANLPMSGIHLKDSTGNILDYSDIIIGEIKDFIEQIISERDKEWIKKTQRLCEVLEYGARKGASQEYRDIHRGLLELLEQIKTK